MNNNFSGITRIAFSIGGLLVFLICAGCGDKKTTAQGPVRNPRATTKGLIEIWAMVGPNYNNDPGELPLIVDKVKYPFLKVPRVNQGPNDTNKDNTGICCHVGSSPAEVNSNLPLYPPVVPYQCNAVITMSSDELRVEQDNCGGSYSGGTIKIAMINLTDNEYVKNKSLSLGLLVSHVVSHEAGHGFLNSGGGDEKGHIVDNAAGWVMATSIAKNEELMCKGFVPVFTRCQINTIRQGLGLPAEIPTP